MKTTNTEPRLWPILPGVVVGVLLAVTGCTLAQPAGAGPSAPASAPASAPTVSTSASVPPSAPPPSAAPRAPSAPSPQSTPGVEQPVARRQGSMEEYPVVASVYPVDRNGSMVTVNVRLQATKPTQEFAIFGSFNDGNPKVLARSSSAPDAVKMIDGAHHKVYLAATTADGTCLCQPQAPYSLMFPDRSNEIWLSVSFAAPPADVTTVDVVVPRFGTFSHVPIH